MQKFKRCHGGMIGNFRMLRLPRDSTVPAFWAFSCVWNGTSVELVPTLHVLSGLAFSLTDMTQKPSSRRVRARTFSSKTPTALDNS